MSEQPTRPAALPSDAKWEPSKVPGYEWKQYALDEGRKKHGLSRSWTADGVLHAETTYVHGKKHGPNKNFHPDGRVSSLAEWRDDVQYDCLYFRGAAPSTEPWPGDAGEAVHSVGFYSLDGVTNQTVRYFDARGEEVAMSGAPLPPRPGSVPDTARWFPDRKEWVDGAVARASNRQVGRWRWWTIDGWLRHEEERDDRGGAGVTIDYQRSGAIKEKRTALADGGGELWEVWHPNGVQKIKKHTDAKKRVHYLGRWGEDGGLWDEKTNTYDGQELVAVTEREAAGVVSFEARREGPGTACRLYEGGKLAASGMLENGKLTGTWRIFDGERVRREVVVDAPQKPSAEGLLWKLGDAAYRVDEPAFATPTELSGVDAVAWGELETAYGAAAGFERLLRGLVADDPLVRMVARGKLSNQITHQGSTYPSSAAVIPWLVKLLAHPRADRLAILGLIRGLGEAALPYLAECSPGDEEWPAIGGVVEAVRAGWPGIFALFAGGDVALRREIMTIGKAVPAAAGELGDVARRDPDPTMRACAIDALPATHDLSPCLADPDPLVRAVAAIAIARARRGESPEAVVPVLGEAAREAGAIAERWSALPFTDGHVLASIAAAAGAIRTPAARALAPTLSAGLDSVDGRTAISYGQGLLALAFGKGERPFAPQFVDILDVVSRSRAFWTFNVNAHEVLQLWKLPTDQRDLETLLAELRAAKDPEEHLRAKLGIEEPAEASEDEDDDDEGEDDDEEEEEEAPPPPKHPALAELARFAEKEHAPELCARPDALAHAQSLLEACPEADRQEAAQYIQQIAGEALRFALDGKAEGVIVKLAALADDLAALGRRFDGREAHARIWPITEGRAEPAMFALAAARYERAEELAREQLADSRCAQYDNHALELVLARAAAGLPPAPDMALVDPRYDHRTSDRLSLWLAKQPADVLERVLDAVPPETRLSLLVEWPRANVIARVSQPLERVIAATEAVLERIASGVLPATVGGATSPLSDLLWVDGKLRSFFKKRACASTDERLWGRGWQLYSYLVNASKRHYDEKYVREAIDEAKKLGVGDADWVADVVARLDRDELTGDTRARAGVLLPRIAGGGAIVGQSVGDFCEAALPERARQRLLELVLEHAPGLAWPVLAAMSDGNARRQTLELSLDPAGGYHAIKLAGDGEILARLAVDARAAGDVAALAQRARDWLALIQLYSARLPVDRAVAYGEALLGRADLVAHLAATEVDHVQRRGFSVARQPLAVVFSFCAQRVAQRDKDTQGAVKLCEVALRFPRGRGEAEQVRRGLVSPG